MSARRFGIGIGCAIVALCGALAGTASAAPEPAWNIESVGLPTNFPPGSEGQAYYEVSATNVGGGDTDRSPITLVDILPAGLEVEALNLAVPREGSEGRFDVAGEVCEEETVGSQVKVRCEIDESIPFAAEPALVQPGGFFQLMINVKVPADAAGQLVNEATVEGGGTAVAATESANQAIADPAPAGVRYFSSEFLDEDGTFSSRAGSHPFQYVNTFAVNTELGPPGGAKTVPAGGDVRNQEFDLPMGIAGNASAIERCTRVQFGEIHGRLNALGSNIVRNACPDGSAVGFIILQQLEGSPSNLYEPIFSLDPPPGMPVQFGFQVAGAPFYINTKVRSDGDYGITAYLQNITQVKRIMGAKTFFWGVPADPRHDPFRGDCLNDVGGGFEKLSLGNCPAGYDPTPFFTMPTSCASPVSTLFSYDTWTAIGAFSSKSSSYPPSTGCGEVAFSPSLEARPSTNVTDSPSGLRVDIHVPQSEDPEGRGTAHLRKAVVTLPPGLVVNPSSANGLAACSPAQIGLTSAIGATPRFTGEGATCPDAAKIGTVEIDTPLLGQFEGGKVKRDTEGRVIPETLRGSVYVAVPHDNPFGSLIALYFAIDDPKTGLVIKLAGDVALDPETGRVTSTFDENPQLPFEDLRVRFFEGATAPLRTPATCGTYSTTSSLTPWSAPESGPPATPSDTYGISAAPGGGSCAESPAQLPHAPAFEAGTVTPVAGNYSPLVLKLRRQDGSQEFDSLSVSTPPGLLGKLVGIPYCSEGALAVAAAKPGEAEKASSSCPAASRLGTVTVGAGAGPAPYYVSGEAYLSGPYRGAPLSMAILTPATAGPFDLGTVVVRTALYVDPETARITAKSDPIPHILQGIPLDVRSIDVSLDRPGFTLNPTNCEPHSVEGQVLSTLGQAASLSSRFQVGECGRLGFKPKLGLRLIGKTKRSGNPRLVATLKMPAGGANVAAATVRLPHSEFLDQGHIRTICTRVQFAAAGGNGAGCPKASVYGHARAWSPLLDQPLSGPVYLRSNGGDRELPDLVAALDGQIDVDLVGYIDSVRGGIRTSFALAPDAPVSKFVLDMQGGKKGLLENSTDICRGEHRAVADFTAQNGKTQRLQPALKARCPKVHRHSSRHRH